MCRGTRGIPQGSNPRSRRLKTTTLSAGPSMSLTFHAALPLGGGGLRGVEFVPSELGMLRNRVSSSSVVADHRSGVMHLEQGFA